MLFATEGEINDFLFKFKFFATSAGGFNFINRDKNMNDLAEINLTPDQAIYDVIAQLTPKHYSSGPEQDKDFKNHKVWIFGYVYDGVELYLKLSDNLKFNIAKCISLHKAKHEITYPYQKGGK